MENKKSWARKKLKDKQPGIEEEEDMMSQHLDAVATSACKENEVATTSVQERRSRHQAEVATAVVKKRCRDIIKRSRHQCTEKEVATTSGCCDINCEDLRSRHHKAVATSTA